jgi:hypothetical protein
LKEKGLIEKAMVSFNLGYKSDKQEQKSTMTFGGFDQSSIQGELHTFSLKTNNWWAVDILEFSYNGDILQTFTPRDKAVAIVDTGTSFTSVPNAIFTTLRRKWEQEIGSDAFLCQSSICISGYSCQETE